MDIKPPIKRTPVVPTPQPVAPPPVPPVELPPIAVEPSGLKLTPRKSRMRVMWTIVSIVVGTLLIALAGAVAWYNYQLAPVGGDMNEKILVKIESGTSPKAIGQLLEEQKVIRSEIAFSLYTRFSGTQNSLQAGTYRLSPGESTQEIVKHLINGTVDTFDITFLPGATLKESREVLIKAGYTAVEVDAALAARYDSPLFAGKPANQDLEGYLYGDTYRFGSGASVEEILSHTFDHFAAVIEENGFVEAFKKRGLTLYEGITLASIIQREAIGGDEAQIAQVFFLRMDQGMMLGSDVTYQYIADKTGVARDPNLNSPYNTRRFTGLPPGPIATPGLAALKAVANPAKGDYVYFLSGDDNVTYFARTNAEHERNIVDHCKVKCSTL